MKICPSCNRTYTDASLNFCLEDGTPLVNESAPGADPNATVRYTEIRDTNPPATQIYPSTPPANVPQSPQTQQPGSRPAQSSQAPHWAPAPASIPGPATRKKSGAIWWVIGGSLVVGIIAIGVVIMLIVLASMNANTNNSNNRNTNLRAGNKNANTNSNLNSNVSNINSDVNLPPLVTDDFSEEKWTTDRGEYGDLWYDNDEYHMRSKEKTYLVMYGPSAEYDTGNADVKVSVRSVDGTPSPTGYGLIVHGQRSKTGDLEDYALLIYTGTDPQYEVIKHKGGQQTTVVPWAKSSAIRTGTSTNQLEVRARGTELSFYINGDYVDKITDTENFKRGVVGLYTSDVTEVAFDDLEIKR
ncbi:MAG TPA: hypothetical protein VHR36_08555 [Pyrinomonadaceae bacterium]|nr:hypothetical protein [Pyrinomonadaceae bacterium]